ncbi:hypothetical protein niasHT_031395 [Heterodera trifolii]|uniref:Uncharacterized protein n=1 Tax=Heterodera trifolii TaxID=157864 RepID=A0ABD2J6Z9_9BILA
MTLSKPSDIKRPQRRSSTASEPRPQQRKSQKRGLRPTQAHYNVPIRNGTAKQDRGIRLHPASSAMALTEARNPVPFSNASHDGKTEQDKRREQRQSMNNSKGRVPTQHAHNQQVDSRQSTTGTQITNTQTIKTSKIHPEQQAVTQTIHTEEKPCNTAMSQTTTQIAKHATQQMTPAKP